ncbi:Lrp/AsnC family transcriptional regulator [Nocardia cyriacigeorgica]|uniref:Lrp/AsnC family transcriptional regulator n=1 Tax=Nocardia cyriacigeorgica TaxID=135487 RepID=UPI0024563655|nr:Lrp/AsnC family transcriptional regulator [Nocardia cyriacigeorgica]
MTDGSGARQERGVVHDAASDPVISEQDLSIIDALQTAPRAPWSRVASALDVDATTAARRWERMRADHAAWLTAYPSARVVTVAYIEVRCRPRSVEAVSAATAQLPWVFCVDETAGEFDLLISAGAADLTTLGRWVREGLGGLRGVRSFRMRVGITLFGEGRDWRMRVLPPAQRARLVTPRPSSRTAFVASGLHRLSAADQALLTALHADARTSFAALGSAIGASEHTARRRLERMQRNGDIVLRCDFAYTLAGLSTLVIYSMAAPQGRLSDIGAALAAVEQVRLCVAVTGRHGLMVHALLPGLTGIEPFEAMLADRFPALEIRDRAVVLHSPKRMGWLLDDRGRATGRIPLSPPT